MGTQDLTESPLGFFRPSWAVPVPQRRELGSCQGQGAGPLVSGLHRVGQWEGIAVGWGLPAPMSSRLLRLSHLLLSSILTAVCGSDPTPGGKSNVIQVRGWGWGWLPCLGASASGAPTLSCCSSMANDTAKLDQGSFLDSLTAPREKGLFLWTKCLGPS